MRWVPFILMVVAMFAIVVMGLMFYVGAELSANKFHDVDRVVASPEPATGSMVVSILSDQLMPIILWITAGFVVIFATLIWLVGKTMKLESSQN